MKKTLFLFILVFLLILSGCKTTDSETVCGNKNLSRHSKTWTTYFDTSIAISLYCDNKIPDDNWEKIEDALKHIEYTFSRTDENSELYKLNAQAGKGPIQVSDELYNLIKTAIYYADLTDGKFDPTIGPLVELWGITTDEFYIPTEEEINSTLMLVDYKLLNLNDENKTVELTKEGMIVDLGAIAKGFAADYVADIVKEMGYTTAIINLGGNVLTIGNRPEKNYKDNYNFSIGISKPRIIDLQTGNATDKQNLGNVFVSNKTVVCSGTYERYNVIDGKFYHHILDPYTGYPAGNSRTSFIPNDLSQVAIITSSSTTADALSTSVFALGLEKGLELIESMEDVEAMFITYDGTVYYSSKFNELYQFDQLID